MMRMTTQKQLLESVPKRLFIGGEWRHSSSGATFPVHDPATGAVLCEIADGSIADGAAALDAAVAAQASWAKGQPSRSIGTVAHGIRDVGGAHRGFCALMTLEMGKPLAEARVRSPMARSSSAGSPRRRCVSTAGMRWRRTRPPAW